MCTSGIHLLSRLRIVKAMPGNKGNDQLSVFENLAPVVRNY